MLLLRVSARRHLVKGFSTMSETSTELPGPVEISIRTKVERRLDCLIHTTDKSS